MNLSYKQLYAMLLTIGEFDVSDVHSTKSPQLVADQAASLERSRIVSDLLDLPVSCVAYGRNMHILLLKIDSFQVYLYAMAKVTPIVVYKEVEDVGKKPFGTARNIGELVKLLNSK